MHKPMLCKDLRDSRLIGDDYAMEMKFDGWRWMIEVAYDGSIVHCGGRNSQLYNSPSLEPISDALKSCQLPAGTVLDGELVGLIEGQEVTSSNVPSILANARVGKLELIVFDVLQVGKVDCRRLTWKERRIVLKKALANALSPVFVSVVFAHEAIDQLLEFGEGVVFKRESSTYRSGRSSDWLKYKTRHTMDGVVSRVMPSNEAVFEIDLDNGAHTSVKIQGNDLFREVNLNPGSFLGRRIEIAYNGFTISGKPRHPVMTRMREDLE